MHWWILLIIIPCGLAVAFWAAEILLVRGWHNFE
jgi:hypothetical protein